MTSYIDMFRGERVKYTRFDGKAFTALIVEVDGPLEDGQPPSFAKLFVLEAPLGFVDGVPYDSRGSAGSFDFTGEPLAAKYGPSTDAKLDSNNDELLRLGGELRAKEDLERTRAAVAEARQQAAELQQRVNDESKKNIEAKTADNKLPGKPDAAKVAEGGAESPVQPGKAVQ